MTFLTPWWLLALVPWVGLVLWLLAGQRQRVGVPFLELWGGPVSGSPVKRRIQPPPVAPACAIAALLIGILPAASPLIRFGASGPPITIIVDRGITMSAGAAGNERWRVLARDVQPGLLRHFGNGAVNLISVPTGTPQQT